MDRTNDVIVNFTPTGMVPTKQMTPHVPVSASEIVEDVHRALEVGITMVHLHARNPDTGAAAWQAEAFAPIVEGIRKLSRDLVICVSLSGRDFKTLEQRSDVLSLDGELKPDMGSLTLASMNFARQASVNDPDMVQSLARRMQERGIVPELEVFDLGMANYARYLEKSGLIEPPHYANLILGNIATAQADPLHLGAIVRDLPDQTFWSVGGIGDTQLPMNMLAIACGGGVRVGLEDNIWLDGNRTRLARNEDYLNRVRQLVELSGRRVMKPATLREQLCLNPGNGRYGRG